MSEYTPKTHEIRAASVIHRAALIHRQMIGQTIRSAERVSQAEFDRWLAEVERAAAEKAWERFVDVLSAHHEDRAPNVVADMERRNPYRRNEGGNDD